MMKKRCDWGQISQLMIDYHDKEWGVPVHDDNLLFESVVLDGAQAGLSWSTILNKRQCYREVYDNFDPGKVSCYDENKISELLNNPGIVRNKLKIRSSIGNARAFLEIRDEFGSFDKYIWSFVGGMPIRNSWKNMNEIPAQTNESDAMSKDLKKRGFSFVGSTICYAFMQAVGMVNDHVVDCFRYGEV